MRVVKVGIIPLGTNILSLVAQRGVARNSDTLAQIFTRLASGQRISKASDDAAGLSVAQSLGAASRVYGQAIRNTNDAISLLNIADGASDQLTQILTRMKELAGSAANGTLSLTQRRSLDTEAYELQKEFNRITQTTQFNSRSLLGGNFGNLNIQAGFGSSATLSFNLGTGLERNVGTGTFAAANNQIAGGSLTVSGDFNTDGKLDLVIDNQLMLGNGNGTFQAGSVFLAGWTCSSVKASDVNGDGKLDLIGTDASSIQVLLGNGDGTFKTKASYSLPGVSGARFQLADMNGDGVLDFVGGPTGALYVALGNSNGSFASVTTYSGSGNFQNVEVGDVNGDGNLDVVGLLNTGTSFVTFLGSASGALKAAGSTSTGGIAFNLRLGDLNHDGLADVAYTYGPDLITRLSNQDASFQAAKSNAFSAPVEGFEIIDQNYDGNLDIVGTPGNLISFIFGNGDGSFQTQIESVGSGISLPQNMIWADFNSDGVNDLFLYDGDNSVFDLQLANSQKATYFQRVNLLTQSDARSALSIIDSALDRVIKERGNIGSFQSRLESATRTLQSTQLNYQGAYSRIMDVDVAAESAALVATQIRQQAASAVLAQANQIPALALRLLAE